MKNEARTPYVLGHGSDEHRRLMLQSRFVGDLTETVFMRAGLAPGMSVLDIGCGAGDVSFLAAAFVGPTGKVLGIDQSPDSVALASERAKSAGLTNVRFEVGILENLQQAGPFDALVGRLILLYLQDPAATLKKLAELVRPGGLVIFQEMEMATARSVPDIPLWSSCGKWIVEAFKRAGVETAMLRQHLAKPFGAEYCAGAEASHDVVLSLCEYASSEAATLGRGASTKGLATIPNREIVQNGATTLTLRERTRTPESHALVERMKHAFAALTK